MLRLLRDKGPTPRTDLASSLTLSSGSVTRIASELVACGLLQELEPLPSAEMGRRRVPVDMRAEGYLVAGVHIGLKYTTYGLVDLRGRVVEGPRKIVHANTEPRVVVDEVVEAVAELVAARPDEAQILGTGISSGGAVETVSGTVTDHGLLGWHDVDIAGLIGNRLDGLLTVESTYRAMATAEMWFGAARDVGSFVQLFMGTAIGAALVIDGALYDGVGMRAGGVAHVPVSRSAMTPCVCGRGGCLTSVGGVWATLERARAAGLDVATTTDLAGLADAGDQRAARVLHDRSEAIGEAMGVLVDVLAPARVVLAGVVLSPDVGLRTLREAVAANVMYPIDADSMVVSTALGEPTVANVVASATPVLKHFYDDPLAHILPDSLTVGVE